MQKKIWWAQSTWYLCSCNLLNKNFWDPFFFFCYTCIQNDYSVALLPYSWRNILQWLTRGHVYTGTWCHLSGIALAWTSTIDPTENIQNKNTLLIISPEMFLNIHCWKLRTLIIFISMSICISAFLFPTEWINFWL